MVVRSRGSQHWGQQSSSSSVDEPVLLLSLQACRNIAIQWCAMKRGRNKLSIRDRTSVKAIYRPTTTNILHMSRTARNTSLAYGLTVLVLKQLVRWDFSRSDPHSLGDTSKCKLMFTVLLAFCLKQGLLKPFTNVPHTIFFLFWKSL